MPDGAEWVLVVEPSRLFQSPGLRRIVDVVLPERRRATFTARYGLDISKVEQLVVAGYADGLLSILRGAIDADRVLTATEEAMDAVETGESPGRAAVPLVIGLQAEARYLLTRSRQGDVVWGEGNPAAWSKILQFLRGQQPELGPIALQRAAFWSEIAASDVPISLHVMSPLALPLDTPLGMVLAEQQQLAVTIDSPDSQTLQVSVALQGSFPDTITDNLKSAFVSIAAQPLGTALGLSDAAATLRVDHSAAVVRMSALFPVERLAQGLEAMFGAELWHLLRSPAETR